MSALFKTSLRELHERPRPVRQPAPARRQAMFLVGGHFAEGAVVPVRQEHRVVTKALRAARRPNQRTVNPRFKFFNMAVRPSEAERRNEMGPPPVGGNCTALEQQSLNFLHRGGKIF